MIFVLFLFFVFISPPVQAATPEGWVDTVIRNSATNLHISGWARDPDHPDQPTEVHVYVDGPYDSGTMLGSSVANNPHGNIGNHGFSLNINLPAQFQTGSHTIYVYGLDVNRSNHSLIPPGKKFSDNWQNPLETAFNNLFCQPTNNANLTITGGRSDLNTKLSTNLTMGGAIASLKLNGLETVNINDHGREIQYAFQIDGQGEGKNPTEAGNLHDGDTSSSIFLGGCTDNKNRLYTHTQMGYWHEHNGLKTSPYVMEKIVQIGIPDHPNAIKFLGKFTMAENVKTIIIEIPTGYHTIQFNKISLFNLQDYSIRDSVDSDFQKNLWGVYDLAINQSSQLIPVLSNGSYSLAPYSPMPNVFYFFGQSNQGETTKWNVARYHVGPFSKGDNYYTESYLVIDTPQNIQASLTKLIKSFKPTSTQPLSPTSIPLTPGDVNGDKKIDLTDYSLWKEQFILGELGTKDLSSSPADFNQDNKVNILDYSIWKQAYIDSLNKL